VPSAGGCCCGAPGAGGAGGGAAAPCCGGAFRFGAWGATGAPGWAAGAAAAPVVAAAARAGAAPRVPPEGLESRPASAGRLQQTPSGAKRARRRSKKQTEMSKSRNYERTGQTCRTSGLFPVAGINNLPWQRGP